MSTLTSRKLWRIAAVFSLMAVLLISAGCGGKKASAEANALLSKALQSLADKDFMTFQACVTPSQQANLPNLPEGPFFAAASGYGIDNEFDTNVTATTASVMADLYFSPDKKEFSTINWALRQEGGKWYIDLDETIRGEKARNGANAFQSWIIKVQKR
ncbi:MAG: hypothetical protein NTW38_00010 [Candidatus Aminicenantes bacterium]|nr:hypothetical protein [Candidatus Aminicenantes bacterium]